MDISSHAENLRLFSAYSDLEFAIDRADAQIDRTPEGELSAIIRDGLIDLKFRMAGVINNLARREAERERLEAALEAEAA